MSRIGRMPITVPAGVTIQIENNLVTVPDLSGLGAETANAKLLALGFNVRIDGLLENSAKVTGQDPEPGEALPEGSLITIKVRSLSGTE